MAFLGNVDGFRYTTSAALNPNTVVVSGGLVGVTRQACAANGTIWAFFGGPRSIYGFTLASAAGAIKTQGTKVYVDANGALTFSAQTGEGQSAVDNTFVGYLAAGIAATDTDIQVIIG